MSNIDVNLSQTLPQLRPTKLSDNVRVGNNFDGGYVIPLRSLEQITRLVSFGLGQDCSFELKMKNAVKDLSIDVYDHTVSPPTARSTISSLILSILFRSPGKFKNYRRFTREYKALFKGATHYRQRVNNHHYRSYDVSILDILKKSSGEKIALKIDIESDEYKIINQIISHSENINLMVIEFHNIGIHLDQLIKILNDLSRIFIISHLHANNFGDLNDLGVPDVLEVTFIPIWMVTESEFVSKLPLQGLDFPNKQNSRDFQITWG